jgi:hypothetical protein
VGCRADVQLAVLPDAPPTERAANSFIHCVESSTSGCIDTNETAGGWDAFYLLTWLADGSPVSILESLPNELAAHADATFVQRRFISEVERYATAIRGAQCQAAESQEMGPLIDKAGQAAASRLEQLGLWQRNMDRVISGLVEEAHQDLDSGRLVRLDCAFEPFQVYVAAHEDEGLYRVVGMTTYMPATLGGVRPTHEQVDDRLHSRSLGLDTAQANISENEISNWLPFPVEVF